MMHEKQKKAQPNQRLSWNEMIELNAKFSKAIHTNYHTVLFHVNITNKHQGSFAASMLEHLLFDIA